MILKNNKEKNKLLALKPIDLCLFLLFPMLISLIYLWSNIYFPDYRTNPLFLFLSNPQWWQFITMNFVHFNFIHYFVNLFVYLLFGLAILFILRRYSFKKSHIIVFLLIGLIILSIFTGVISIFVYKKGIAGGSSGITAAMFMFLVVIIIYFNIQKVIKKIKTKELLLKLTSWSIFTILGMMSLFQKDNKINIFGHLVGIIFGLIIAIILLKKTSTNNKGHVFKEF